MISTAFGISKACCGTKAYNTKLQLCCSGVINARLGFSPACCGTKAYDAKFKNCCQGKITSGWC